MDGLENKEDDDFSLIIDDGTEEDPDSGFEEFPLCEDCGAHVDECICEVELDENEDDIFLLENEDDV